MKDISTSQIHAQPRGECAELLVHGRRLLDGMRESRMQKSVQKENLQSDKEGQVGAWEFGGVVLLKQRRPVHGVDPAVLLVPSGHVVVLVAVGRSHQLRRLL